MYTGRSRGVDDGIDGGQLDYRLYGRGRVGGSDMGKQPVDSSSSTFTESVQVATSLSLRALMRQRLIPNA